MSLETYKPKDKPKRKMGRPTAQDCEHDDCFTCPYPDCIASAQRMAELMKGEPDGRKGMEIHRRKQKDQTDA